MCKTDQSLRFDLTYDCRSNSWVFAMAESTETGSWDLVNEGSYSSSQAVSAAVLSSMALALHLFTLAPLCDCEESTGGVLVHPWQLSFD